jgi:hypothetical protein
MPAPTRRQGSRRSIQETPYSPEAEAATGPGRGSRRTSFHEDPAASCDRTSPTDASASEREQNAHRSPGRVAARWLLPFRSGSLGAGQRAPSDSATHQMRQRGSRLGRDHNDGEGAASGARLPAAASRRGCRANQTPCPNLTRAVFADLVRAAQAARHGPPRPKWFTPES